MRMLHCLGATWANERSNCLGGELTPPSSMGARTRSCFSSYVLGLVTFLLTISVHSFLLGMTYMLYAPTGSSTWLRTSGTWVKRVMGEPPGSHTLPLWGTSFSLMTAL